MQTLNRLAKGLTAEFRVRYGQARRRKSFPSVLSPEEVLHFLSCVDNLKHQTILTACYAAGLRISEAVSLKSRNFDSQRMVLHIEEGKGTKIAT
jgi:integrase/recombinase XerD